MSPSHTETKREKGAGRSKRPVHRVFIVDDHPVFRAGVRRLIEHEGDLTVCGEAATAAEALEQLRHTTADVVVVDISLPGANGIELVKNLRFEHPDLPLMVLSAHDEQLYGMRALRAGASGYLTKRAEPELLLAALHKVLAGQIWVSPEFGEQLIFQMARGKEGDADTPVRRLTDRELEILQLLGRARTTQEIAAELHLSVKTVESHRLHIKEKLGLKNAPELVRFATEWSSQQPN